VDDEGGLSLTIFVLGYCVEGVDMILFVLNKKKRAGLVLFSTKIIHTVHQVMD